jgi:hypothetical protein
VTEQLNIPNSLSFPVLDYLFFYPIAAVISNNSSSPGFLTGSLLLSSQFRLAVKDLSPLERLARQKSTHVLTMCYKFGITTNYVIYLLKTYISIFLLNVVFVYLTQLSVVH